MFSWYDQPMIKKFYELNIYKNIYTQFLSQFQGKILIYGINDTIKYFIHAMPDFRKNIVKIVDINYTNFSNDAYCGLKVESPAGLKNFKCDYFITSETIRSGEIKASLERYGALITKMIDWENAFAPNYQSVDVK